MDYDITVWIVFKRFFLDWLIAGVGLVIVSCVKHGDFIMAAVANNTLAWFEAILPIGLTLYAIVLMVKSVFQ